MFACTPDGAVPTLRHHPSSEWFGYSIPGTVGPIPRLRSRTPIVQPAARARALTIQAAQRAARARIELAIVIPLIAIVLLANEYRREVFGLDLPVRVFTAIALLILGWRLARDIGRTLAPQLFRRMDPATAGTVGFLIRLGFLVGAVLLALPGRGPRAAHDRRVRRDRGGVLRPRGAADARQPDRGRGPDLRAPVQGGRPRAAAVGRSGG